MKSFKKLLGIGTSLALFSSLSFATSCPDIGGYELKSHDRNNQICTYTSNGAGSIGIKGTKATQQCPRFILTDPGFHQDGKCHVVLNAAEIGLNNQGNHKKSAAHCECTIRANR